MSAFLFSKTHSVAELGSSTGRVSAEFGVTVRALRHYEEIGILKPARVDKSRVYSQKDRDRLAQIVMARKTGFGLPEISQLLDIQDEINAGRQDVTLLIERYRARSEALKNECRQLAAAVTTLEEEVKRLSQSS